MQYQVLGYDTYDEFLTGVEWEEIRNFYYHSGVAYRCRTCHKTKDLRLHKRSYYNLTPKFYKWLFYHKRKLFFKFLVYLCPHCNTLIHFYDGKKLMQKVPLDYIFLWDREQQIYWRIDKITMRFLRTIWREGLHSGKWLATAYRVAPQKKRMRFN